MRAEANQLDVVVGRPAVDENEVWADMTVAMIVPFMLIRLAPMTITVSVVPIIKPFVGRRRGIRPYSEQRTEGIEG